MVLGLRRQKLGIRDDQVTSAANLTLRQSIYPVFLVTILFFLWGFAYGLLDVLNKHFQEVLHVTRAQSSGLQGAYFGAYFLGPLTYSGWVLRRYGYKVTFILGLCIYGVGALMFWPAGVNRSFGGFCGAMFIVGSGLSTLETAANPFIAICGPPKYSEMRLNLAQAVQGTGSVVAPILASHVFFKSVGEAQLTSVQWVYLGIACFVFVLAVVFYFAPIPEITDADMANQVQDTTGSTETTSIWKERNLWFGVFSQFCYVGSQCAVAGFFINIVTEMKPGTSTAMGSNYLSIAQAIFAIGRFIAGGCMKFVKPRYVLLAFIGGCIAFAATAIEVKGDAGIAIMCLVLFFESCCFPTIFSLAIRGLGANTKRGSSFIVASICGGAVFPPMMGAVGDAKHSTRFAMVVPLAGFAASFAYPVYVNLFERERMDEFRNSEIGMQSNAKDVEINNDADSMRKGESAQVEKL
ncbi:putative L-fucose-proton symporter [Geopyxis carbonaria]|nr:putative L-fucose-proton symporter [Geopyxis carbonaria]